jgi:carboxypeptidase A4
MKLLSLTLASLGLASAASVASPVDYNKWQVYRVTVGEDKAKLSKVMSNLKLTTWKGKVETSDVVDVVVPPTQVDAFVTSTKDFNTMLMHENLGDSIAEESTFGVYAKGVYTRPKSQLDNSLTTH